MQTLIDRISGATTWANSDLLAGDGTADSAKTFSFQVGAATGTKNQISVSIGSLLVYLCYLHLYKQIHLKMQLNYS